MVQIEKNIEPVGEAGTLADRVANLLASEIRSNLYPVNARLPTEQTMTEQYGVSRTVIREAMSRLKYEGLVETRQGSGTVVLSPNARHTFRLSDAKHNPGEGVFRILELRRGIEAEMAALAATRRTAVEMRGIREALRSIVRAVESGGDGVTEDLSFHMAIARSTHNDHYVDLLEMLTRSLHDAIRVTRSNEARQAGLVAQVNAEHKSLCMAIDNQDVVAARTAAFLHMQNTESRLRQVDKGFWQGASGVAAKRLARARLSQIATAKRTTK